MLSVVEFLPLSLCVQFSQQIGIVSAAHVPRLRQRGQWRTHVGQRSRDVAALRNGVRRFHPFQQGATLHTRQSWARY